MKHVLTFLRSLGALSVAVGILLLFSGRGLWRPIAIAGLDGIAILPVHLSLVVLGTLIFLAPQIAPWSLAVFLLVLRRKDTAKEIFKAVDNAEEPRSLDENLTALEKVEQEIGRLRRKSTRRYITVLSLGVVALLIAPAIATEINRQTDFYRDSLRLCRAIDNNRLDFDSADHFRRVLLEVEPSFRLFAPEGSSSKKLYDLLSQLYDNSVASDPGFRDLVRSLYQEEVADSTRLDVGLLPTDFFVTEVRLLNEPGIAEAAYYAVLGMLALEASDQGRRVGPALVARQLFHHALGATPTSAPALNGLGNALASLIEGHSQYVSLFENATQQVMTVALGDVRPLDKTQLATRAIAAFSEAAEQAPTAYSRARSLNNQADVVLRLIMAAHVRNEPLGQGLDPDLIFLTEEVDPPPQDPATAWTPTTLWSSLDRCIAKLDTASEFAREPDIFFTRAQARGLKLKLLEKYSERLDPSLPGRPPLGRNTNPTAIIVNLLGDLNTARDLGLPATYFSRANAERFGLDSAWLDDGAARFLTLLASNG